MVILKLNKKVDFGLNIPIFAEKKSLNYNNKECQLTIILFEL